MALIMSPINLPIILHTFHLPYYQQPYLGFWMILSTCYFNHPAQWNHTHKTQGNLDDSDSGERSTLIVSFYLTCFNLSTSLTTNMKVFSYEINPKLGNIDLLKLWGTECCTIWGPWKISDMKKVSEYMITKT